MAPGLVGVRRALTRLLGQPIGLSGSGPTLWTLYPSLGEAEDAAVVDAAVTAGALPTIGDAPPSIVATTIRTGQEERRHDATGDLDGECAGSGRPVQPGDSRGRLMLRRSGRDRWSDPGGAPAGPSKETERTLRNLAAVLDAAGATFADVVKTTVFLADINDFTAMNAVYAVLPRCAPRSDDGGGGRPAEGFQGRDRGHRAPAVTLRAARRVLTLSGAALTIGPTDDNTLPPVGLRMQRGRGSRARPTPRMNPPSPDPAASTVSSQTGRTTAVVAWPRHAHEVDDAEGAARAVRPAMLAYVLDAWGEIAALGDATQRPVIVYSPAVEAIQVRRSRTGPTSRSRTSRAGRVTRCAPRFHDRGR